MKWKRRESQSARRKRLIQEAQARRVQNEARVPRADEVEAFWEARRHRMESEAAYEHWENVFAKAFAGTSSHEWETKRALRRLFDKKPADLEPLVAFLETDPWTFRSGYDKADAIRFLKRADLTNETKNRLRQVVLRAVDHRDRREFRHFCRLARAVDSSDLRAALRERLLTHPDPNVRRRAGWALHACEQKQ